MFGEKYRIDVESMTPENKSRWDAIIKDLENVSELTGHGIKISDIIDEAANIINQEFAMRRWKINDEKQAAYRWAIDNGIPEHCAAAVFDADNVVEASEYPQSPFSKRKLCECDD